MGEGARFTSATVAREFILAGSATLTLVSDKTGARFTYRVKAKESETSQIYFVSLLNGASNESDYGFLGTIFGGVRYVHGTKSRVGEDAPSAKAFAWTFERIARGELPANCQIWHEGRCGRCGRKLTVPSSIESGLGPICETLGG